MVPSNVAVHSRVRLSVDMLRHYSNLPTRTYIKCQYTLQGIYQLPCEFHGYIQKTRQKQYIYMLIITFSQNET